MKKYCFIVLLILALAINSIAQTQNPPSTQTQQPQPPVKSKSLTMEDVSPIQPSTPDPSTDKPTSKSRKSKSTKKDSKDPNSSTSATSVAEGIWQDRMDETEINFLTAELRSELSNRSNESVIELNRQKQYFKELSDEGSKQGFSRERSVDVIYREKYVKLRIQIAEEERINPPSETQLLYADSRKSRKKRLKTSKSQNIPLLDTKAVKARETKLDKLINKMEDLEEEGRREGVPAKIFED
jgi:hypothetical protein